MRREWWLAGGLLVVVQAAVLAALFTPAPHPGGDNAGYLALGHALATGAGYVELWAPGTPPHTKYPPAFPALLAVMMWVGASTWGAFKTLSALLVSMAGVLAFAWAGGRKGAVAGLGVALLTLISSGWLEASRWILSEPLFLCAVLLTFWAADRGGLKRGEDAPRTGWLVLAAAGAFLAILTRSAGLPVILALVGILLLRREWKWAGIVTAPALLLGGWWALRSRTDADGAYQSEFWMVNPYDPELGTIGLMGLLGRVWTNTIHYGGTVIPGEWSTLVPVGIVLLLLAGAGWALRLERAGVAELFLPLYVGMILLWPEVWSGDRFVLPLYPLILLYAGEVVTRIPEVRIRWAALVVGILVLAVPAVPTAVEKVEVAGECRAIGAQDPFRCLGPGMMGFRDAAAWSGRNLPEDAVVFNRKPRIFTVLGGTVGRTYPFTRDPEHFLAEADAHGARYLLLDQVDGISGAYLPAILQGAPGAFCWIGQWGEVTDLLGILPPEARGGNEILSCPQQVTGTEGGAEIPLLSRTRR